MVKLCRHQQGMVLREQRIMGSVVPRGGLHDGGAERGEPDRVYEATRGFYMGPFSARSFTSTQNIY